MMANRHSNVRTAVCWNDEITYVARSYDNANIISIPTEFVSISLAYSMIVVFLSTSFKAEKYKSRIERIERVN